ncbi:MAG: hypothetical protein ACK44B_10040, partial [Flavobacteriales bacterium]
MFLRSFLFVMFVLAIRSVFAQEISHDHSILHSFIENKGQWPVPVLFKARFSGGNLWVQQNKFVFHLQDFSALKELHGR